MEIITGINGLLGRVALCAAMFVAGSSAWVSARVTLPHVLSDGMVLQQRTDVKLWGKGAPGAKVTAIPSWNGVKCEAKVGKDSIWSMDMTTPSAGGPYDIRISDGDGSPLVLKDVLVGEVWFCAGQSNMEMPMKGFDRQPLKGMNGVIAKAKPSTPVRVFTPDSRDGNWVRTSAKTPQSDVDGVWWDNTPEHVANTSAVAYLFARYINEVLDVPVGIIVSSLGGSRIEPWMSREAMAEFPGYSYEHLNEGVKDNAWNDPCLLFNGKVSPFTSFPVRGLIWYQGESNRHNADIYDRLMAAMVKDWRARWGGGEMPFYFVEIAPFRYEGDKGDSAAKLREAQSNAVKLIPNSGIASTLDAGNYNFIHPVDKRTPAERLAWLALTDTYGMKGFGSHSPRYESMEVKDGKIYINVTDAPSGLCPMWTSLTGFEIAGADRKFYPAFAEIEEKTCRLAVSSKDVPEPVAVRYCYKNVPEPSVYNVAGLPLLPFRTDDRD